MYAIWRVTQYDTIEGKTVEGVYYFAFERDADAFAPAQDPFRRKDGPHYVLEPGDSAVQADKIRTIAQALIKLTPTERRALGLPDKAEEMARVRSLITEPPPAPPPPFPSQVP